MQEYVNFKAQFDCYTASFVSVSTSNPCTLRLGFHPALCHRVWCTHTDLGCGDGSLSQTCLPQPKSRFLCDENRMGKTEFLEVRQLQICNGLERQLNNSTFEKILTFGKTTQKNTFWTSGDVCPGFQSQGGYRLHTFLPACYSSRFTSGATPANLMTGQHGSPSHSLHAELSRGRMLGFEQGISRSEHRCSIHSATTPTTLFPEQWVQICLGGSFERVAFLPLTKFWTNNNTISTYVIPVGTDPKLLCLDSPLAHVAFIMAHSHQAK